MKTQSEEMRTFVAVVDCSSVTGAAQQLGLTPSAVSRTLAKLEDKLSTTLLNRTTRRMELTEEGKFFLDSARQILQQFEMLEERLEIRQQQPAGRLRVNAAVPFMVHAIMPHIGDFRAQYPEIQLELNTDDLNINLLEQSTDLAIRIGNLNDSTLHARALGVSKLRLVASPEYLIRCGSPATFDDLAKHSLLGFTQPDNLNIWPVANGAHQTRVIKPTLCASSGETLRQLALSGQGIACLAGFMTEKDLIAGRLTTVLDHITTDQNQAIHAVYYRNSQLARRILCFLDFLQDRLTDSLGRVR